LSVDPTENKSPIPRKPFIHGSAGSMRMPRAVAPSELANEIQT
jgi:hypothetical protein